MANSKPEKNTAGKIILSRAKIFIFLNHCKRSLEAVFSNMVSAGDGLQKRKGINKGFMVSFLFLLSEFQPAVRALRLSWSPEAGVLYISVPKESPAKKSPCSFFSLAPKEICFLRDAGAMIDTDLSHPTNSHLLPLLPENPSSLIVHSKKTNGQHLPIVIGNVHRPYFIGDGSQICL